MWDLQTKQCTNTLKVEESALSLMLWDIKTMLVGLYNGKVVEIELSSFK